MAGKGTNLGNINKMKYKTSEERKALCIQYVEHIRKGLSDNCFPECDMETLKKYMNNFPSDFDSDQIARARRERQLVGIDGTIGLIKKALTIEKKELKK